MNIISDVSPSAVSAVTPVRSLSWGAIFAGAVASLALQIVLMMLAAGLGLAIFNPITAENPLEHFGTGAAVLQGITAVVSLWAGGWVAGRFSGRFGLKEGCLHGFMVWCLATVTAIGLVAFGAGWILGDLSKMVGGGLSMAGKPAAAAVSGAGDLAKDALQRSNGMIASFVDEGLGNAPAGRSAAEGVRAKRELGFAVAKLFNGAGTDQAANQQAVVDVLIKEQGMTDADAKKLVSDWNDSYQRLKSELAAAKEKAETRAREAADKAAHTLAVLSFCSFVAFVIGAIFASVGGKHGGACAYRRSEDAVIVDRTPVS